jgi:hypothetical protein
MLALFPSLKMTKYNPTTNELICSLVDIHYEISQLLETLIGVNHKGIQFSLLESRLIHIRVLLDFFKKNRTNIKGIENDDVLSQDYGFSTKTVGISRENKEKINKRLAHLTYSRAKYSDEETFWHFEETALPILIRSKEFCEHLIQNFLPQNSPNTIPKWVNLINSIDIKIDNKGTSNS